MARAPSAARSRFVFGSDDANPRTQRHVTGRARDAFEIARHHQGDIRGEDARAEAPATHCRRTGIAAAALPPVPDDAVLSLDGDQRKHLHAVTAHLDARHHRPPVALREGARVGGPTAPWDPGDEVPAVGPAPRARPIG
ncbi:hypothetical protein GCM10010430_66060 [Kitasatospora cystarginea]|uniref:Uncharacterized protein n=1 Tax=Kitasatospora cystarginea TaxID=58350 RepID=A0ABN3ETP1_9ACTN